MTLDDAVDGFTKAYLRTLLVSECGNVTKAAERAGRDRTDLHRLLRKHGLEPRDFRVRIPAECGETETLVHRGTSGA